MHAAQPLQYIVHHDFQDNYSSGKIGAPLRNEEHTWKRGGCVRCYDNSAQGQRLFFITFFYPDDRSR